MKLQNGQQPVAPQTAVSTLPKPRPEEKAGEAEKSDTVNTEAENNETEKTVTEKSDTGKAEPEKAAEDTSSTAENQDPSKEEKKKRRIRLPFRKKKIITAAMTENRRI